MNTGKVECDHKQIAFFALDITFLLVVCVHTL
jgi:hypothetical protein